MGNENIDRSSLLSCSQAYSRLHTSKCNIKTTLAFPSIARGAIADTIQRWNAFLLRVMENSQHSITHRSYAILGTGAIGGFYGGRLQKAGFDVHFLLNSDYSHVKEHGLAIESVDGDFTLENVNAYNNVQEMPPCDVVVVALKTTQNYLLPQLLPPLLKENSIVVLLQNGLGAEEDVGKFIKNLPIIGGLCFVCSNKIKPGHIRHLDYGVVTFAEYSENGKPAGITENIRLIAGDFEKTEIPIILNEDLILTRWKKLVWNVPYNGLSVVLDAQTNELMANEYTRRLAEELMREVVAGAAACDRIIPEVVIEKMLDNTDKMEPYLTSMKLDYDRRNALEIEAIFGNPLRTAQSGGVNLPRMSMLYQQLKFLDARNRVLLGNREQGTGNRE